MCSIVSSHLTVCVMHLYTAPPEPYTPKAHQLLMYMYIHIHTITIRLGAVSTFMHTYVHATAAYCCLLLLPGAADHTAKCEAGEH